MAAHTDVGDMGRWWWRCFCSRESEVLAVESLRCLHLQGARVARVLQMTAVTPRNRER